MRQNRDYLEKMRLDRSKEDLFCENGLKQELSIGNSMKQLKWELFREMG